MPELIVLATPETAAGYRLGGARTVTCRTAADVEEAVVDVAGRASVIAVHGRLWSLLGSQLRHEWTRQTQPLMLRIPDDDEAVAAAHQDELLDLLARAVGFQITFDPEGDTS